MLNEKCRPRVGIFFGYQNLRRICAADGGPCSDSFNLELKVTQVQKESFMIVTVGKGLPSQRYLTGLGVDDEEVSLMCAIGGD
jgi:hypothetical protein